MLILSPLKMNRNNPTSFAICVLLTLTSMSVSVTVLLLFYSSVYYINMNSGFLRPVQQHVESTTLKIRNTVDFIDTYESDFDSKNTNKNISVFSMNQKDKRLWDYIRTNHLTKPSTKRYNLSSSHLKFHPNEYSKMIFSLFKGKNGTFIEAGAFNGEDASNSLYLEERGWQGILVECNPIVLPKLMSKNRKSWISNVCLSLTEIPQTLNFTTPIEWPASARLGKPMNNKEMKEIGIDWMKNKTWLEYQIPCFPLYSIIQAVGKFKTIDFLSLDVEGVEIPILKHFPFEKVFIKVIFVEVLSYKESEKNDLKRFLWSKGFSLVKVLENDHLYIHRKSGLNLTRDKLIK